METGNEPRHFSEPLALRRVFAILRRRWWIVLTAVILVPVVAYAVSTTQKPVYRANAEVLLNQQNLAANVLSGIRTNLDMSGGLRSPHHIRVAMDTTADITAVTFVPVQAMVIVEGEAPLSLSTGVSRTWRFAVGASAVPSLSTAPAVPPDQASRTALGVDAAALTAGWRRFLVQQA